MSSNNVSPLQRLINGTRLAVDRAAGDLEPVLTPIGRATRYVMGSFFRFMIFFGIVLVVLAAFVAGGVVAGHLGIYGLTSIGIGILGRLIVSWKVKDSA